MVADALISLAFLILFLIWFYGPWQGLCTDFARQIIFEQRDRLFDLAADGRLEFDSTEYRELRRQLEALIRFAHELDLPRFIMVSLIVKKTPGLGKLPDAELFSRIRDEATRKQVKTIMIDAVMTLVVMVTAKSLLLLPVFSIAAVILMCSRGIDGIRGKFTSGRVATSAVSTITRGASLVH